MLDGGGLRSVSSSASRMLRHPREQALTRLDTGQPAYRNSHTKRYSARPMNQDVARQFGARR
jgi:hypothetical protein